MNPENAVVHDAFAAILSGSGHTNEAAQHYREAVRLKPDNAEYHYNLGRELIGNQNGAAAEIKLVEACQRAPNNPIYHNTLGVAFSQQNKTEPARAEFYRALKLLPEYTKPYFNLARLEQRVAHDLATAGNFPEAVTQASHAAELARTNQFAELATELDAEIKSYKSARLPANLPPAARTEIPNQK